MCFSYKEQKRCPGVSRGIASYPKEKANIRAQESIHAFPTIKRKSTFQDKQMVSFEKPRLGCFGFVVFSPVHFSGKLVQLTACG